MIIWARWGILGLVIPIAFILIAQSLLKPREPLAVHRPVDPENDSPVDDPMKAKADKRARDDERLLAERRAEEIGFGIGGLLGAAVLWPLGVWMNRTETLRFVDQPSGQEIAMRTGGGHTLFFIPIQYWAFVWAIYGLFKAL